MAEIAPAVDRDAAEYVLIQHARRETSACHCGWGDSPEHLGMSYAAHVVDELLASGVVRVAGELRRDAQAEVADAFVAWAAKNEIAEPPLDWKWFGEIARRYSSVHGGDE